MRTEQAGDGALGSGLGLWGLGRRAAVQWQTPCLVRLRDTIIATFTAIALLPGLAFIAFGAGLRETSLARVKSYSSQREFLKAQHRPIIVEEANTLRFYDASGRRIHEVLLERDSLGYSRRPIIFDRGAVIVRSTSGYEWAADYFDFYGPSGIKTGETNSPFTNWAISPDGSLLVAAEPDSTSEYHHTGRYFILSSAGVKVGEYQSRIPPEMPGASFSPDGRYIVIPSFGLERRFSQGRISVEVVGSVAVLSADGTQVGIYESPGWMPGREYGDSLASGPMRAMTEVDSENNVVISGGFEGRNLRTVIAIDLAGTLLWKWKTGIDRERCESLLRVDRVAKVVLAMDICPDSSKLRLIDLLSGNLLHESPLPLGPGKPLHAAVSVSPKGHYFLLNTRRQGPGTDIAYVSVLLNSKLAVMWRDERSDEFAAEFDSLGRIVLRNQKAIDVRAIK